jgi:hypothetical protein
MSVEISIRHAELMKNVPKATTFIACNVKCVRYGGCSTVKTERRKIKSSDVFLV